MGFEDFYETVRYMKAVALYDQAQRLIEARRDFLYLAEGDNPRIRFKHERANQIMNPLTVASDVLNMDSLGHYTVAQHMLIDPEICRPALDAIIQGMNEFRIRKSWMLN